MTVMNLLVLTSKENCLGVIKFVLNQDAAIDTQHDLIDCTPCCNK